VKVTAELRQIEAERDKAGGAADDSGDSGWRTGGHF
jgi:hypothetical protein